MLLGSRGFKQIVPGLRLVSDQRHGYRLSRPALWTGRTSAHRGQQIRSSGSAALLKNHLLLIQHIGGWKLICRNSCPGRTFHARHRHIEDHFSPIRPLDPADWGTYPIKAPHVNPERRVQLLAIRHVRAARFCGLSNSGSVIGATCFQKHWKPLTERQYIHRSSQHSMPVWELQCGYHQVSQCLSRGGSRTHPPLTTASSHNLAFSGCKN